MISKNATIGRNVEIGQFVVIEDGVVIGDGTVIQHGVKLGDNVITGAMSFVNKDIPEGEVWVGSPAKFFKSNEG